MRLRYWTAIGAGALMTVALLGLRGPGPQPAAKPAALTEVTQVTQVTQVTPQTAPLGPTASPEPPAKQEIWSGALEAGQTLDELLAKAGLSAPERVESSRLIGSLYDLRRLKPAYLVTLASAGEGHPIEVTLEVEDGRMIVALLDDPPSVHSLSPEPETVIRAAETEIRSSIFGALERVDAPTRFATDLELILADVIDLRRKVDGGETLRVVWREDRLGDRVIGQPTIDFAQVDLEGETYEIVWPQDGSARNYIYRNGMLLQSFRQPVPGARLSSAFGPRIHPVHGGRRMHRGVDFAAQEGTQVHAMQDGLVTFAGRKRGYGFLVEIEHPGDVVTRYGHLGAEGLAVKQGERVRRGQAIGAVGNTGTSTAPHLHYEVIVAGAAVSPLEYEWPLRAGSPVKDSAGLLATLEQARDRMTTALQDHPRDG